MARGWRVKQQGTECGRTPLVLAQKASTCIVTYTAGICIGHYQGRQSDSDPRSTATALTRTSSSLPSRYPPGPPPSVHRHPACVGVDANGHGSGDAGPHAAVLPSSAQPSIEGQAVSVSSTHCSLPVTSAIPGTARRHESILPATLPGRLSHVHDAVLATTRGGDR